MNGLSNWYRLLMSKSQHTLLLRFRLIHQLIHRLWRHQLMLLQQSHLLIITRLRQRHTPPCPHHLMHWHQLMHHLIMLLQQRHQLMHHQLMHHHLMHHLIMLLQQRHQLMHHQLMHQIHPLIIMHLHQRHTLPCHQFMSHPLMHHRPQWSQKRVHIIYPFLVRIMVIGWIQQFLLV